MIFSGYLDDTETEMDGEGLKSSRGHQHFPNHQHPGAAPGFLELSKVGGFGAAWEGGSCS